MAHELTSTILLHPSIANRNLTIQLSAIQPNYFYFYGSSTLTFLSHFPFSSITSSYIIYKNPGGAGCAPFDVTFSTALLANDTIAVAGCVCSNSQKMWQMLSIDEGARRATKANTRL